MQTEQDLIKFLKKHRNDARLGAMSDESFQRVRSQVHMQIFGSDQIDQRKYAFGEYFEYVWDNVSNVVLKPAMVGFGAFIMVVGGWMTSVSAASNSLPGDMLYPVKIANEQAKLTFTASDEKKAELHVQFAAKRLDEAKAISNSDRAGKAEQMKTVVEAFKSEVSEAKVVMETIVTAGADATAVATALNETAAAFAGAADEIGISTEEAQGDVTEVAEAAVEVLVTTVENDPAHMAKDDLQATFQNRLETIDQRIKLTLGRITVIETKANEGFVVPRGVDLTSLENVLQSFDGQFNEAMNAMASGGFRKAFAVLDAVEFVIDQTETDVVALELMIIAQKDGSVDLPPLE